MDKHIRRLDTDLARFELEYKEKSSHQRTNLENKDNFNSTDALNASHQNVNASLNASSNSATAETSTSKSRKKKKIEQQPVIIEETPSSLMPITSLGLSLAQPTGIDVCIIQLLFFYIIYIIFCVSK